ncbi:MAG: SCO family protein [Shewanella sp.]
MALRRDVLTMLGIGLTTVGAGFLVKKTYDEIKPAAVEMVGAHKIPNVPLVTHQGKNVRFYDDLVRGKILVMNMMYTSCSGVCPLTTANLIHVQRLLTEQLKVPFTMCSLTLDPAVDDPDILAWYVQQYKLPNEWIYLTGKPENVHLVRTALGFYDVEPSVDSDFASHTGMLRLGHERLERWSMMPAQGQPQQIVNAILHLARQNLHSNIVPIANPA